uniref:Uncharacterized protein n=1 Tax=Physcomitrium patens TaxID=3218 RepID=A0A2K1L8G6_PHYPA|nr:hypothetical protein PHYPA_000754 [Physcomitrium patens]
MGRAALPIGVDRCHARNASAMHGCVAPGKRRAKGGGMGLMRKRERRETVSDSCRGAGGMVRRTRKKEVHNRSNGMGQRSWGVERILAHRIPYCFICFS